MENKIFDIRERTFQYSLALIKFSTKVPSSLVNQIILKQLLRAGNSIGANVAEGFAGSSVKDFVNFYNIALKSANETVYWLRLIKESNNKLEETEFLIQEAEEIAKILAKILIKCRG